MTLPSLVGAVDGWCDNTVPDPRWWRTTSGAVTDDSLTSRAVPSGHGQLRLGPPSVEKIVPSAFRLPPAGMRHQCKGAGEFQVGTVKSQRVSATSRCPPYFNPGLITA